MKDLDDLARKQGEVDSNFWVPGCENFLAVLKELDQPLSCFSDMLNERYSQFFTEPLKIKDEHV